MKIQKPFFLRRRGWTKRRRTKEEEIPF